MCTWSVLQISRTVKFLTGICSCKYILSKEWVVASVSAGRFVGECLKCLLLLLLLLLCGCGFVVVCVVFLVYSMYDIYLCMYYVWKFCLLTCIPHCC